MVSRRLQIPDCPHHSGTRRVVVPNSRTVSRAPGRPPGPSKDPGHFPLDETEAEIHGPRTPEDLQLNDLSIRLTLPNKLFTPITTNGSLYPLPTALPPAI